MNQPKCTATRYVLFFLLLLCYTSCDSSPGTPRKQISLFSLQLFPITTNTFTSNSEKDETKWYTIKTASSDLVMDAAEPTEIKIQDYTGSPQQLWKFEPAGRPGVYYIASKTGAVLAYSSNLNIVLTENTHCVDQQWILNSNGRIFNVGANYNMDVTNAKFVPGNTVHVWRDNGSEGQRFVVQEKSD